MLIKASRFTEKGMFLITIAVGIITPVSLLLLLLLLLPFEDGEGGREGGREEGREDGREDDRLSPSSVSCCQRNLWADAYKAEFKDKPYVAWQVYRD